MSNALTRQIIELKDQGQSYVAIGKVVGMSKDRVQKIYKRYLEGARHQTQFCPKW